jgi:hypothetical protein
MNILEAKELGAYKTIFWMTVKRAKITDLTQGQAQLFSVIK